MSLRVIFFVCEMYQCKEFNINLQAFRISKRKDSLKLVVRFDEVLDYRVYHSHKLVQLSKNTLNLHHEYMIPKFDSEHVLCHNFSWILKCMITLENMSTIIKISPIDENWLCFSTWRALYEKIFDFLRLRRVRFKNPVLIVLIPHKWVI